MNPLRFLFDDKVREIPNTSIRRVMQSLEAKGIQAQYLPPPFWQRVRNFFWALRLPERSARIWNVQRGAGARIERAKLAAFRVERHFQDSHPHTEHAWAPLEARTYTPGPDVCCEHAGKDGAACPVHKSGGAVGDAVIDRLCPDCEKRP